MKTVLTVVAGLMLSNLTVQAQSDANNGSQRAVESQSAQASTQQVEPRESASNPDLPDMPVPHALVPQDGPAPCPAGVGAPCALLGGRLYFKDPFHMTQHDATWGQAMKNPFMIAGEILNMAATIADIEESEACFHAHTCSEGNPILGSHPSRARAYGTTIPLNLGIYAMSGLLKKQGRGNLAFGMLWGGTVLHAFLAAKAAAFASGGPGSTATSSRSRQFGVSLHF